MTSIGSRNITAPVIVLDSQCYSYLIDAMEGVDEPQGDLSREKIALVRLLFYSPEVLLVGPTVKLEYQEITCDERRQLHESFDVIFGDLYLNEDEESQVRRRTDELRKFHKDANDCRIAAEAEIAKADYLVTYDNNFLKRLASQLDHTNLIRPSELWTELGIPKGADTKRRPHCTNPLFNQDWWKW